MVKSEPLQIFGQTPAEAAGISLNLGKDNKIENLMREAAVVKQKTNLELYVFELGIRVNKVQILRKDDNIEIKPKERLEWREINQVLLKRWIQMDIIWVEIVVGLERLIM